MSLISSNPCTPRPSKSVTGSRGLHQTFADLRSIASVLELGLRGQTTSLIRKQPPLGPYSRPAPRVIWGFWRDGLFLMGKVPSAFDIRGPAQNRVRVRAEVEPRTAAAKKVQESAAAPEPEANPITASELELRLRGQATGVPRSYENAPP